MDKKPSQEKIYNTRPALKIIGIISIIIGIFFAIIGPLEFYTYYLFSDGGHFHYEGFGIGSFMFTFITGQIICYYFLAVVFLVLGYGHLKIKNWIKGFSLILLKIWLLVGLPVIIIVILLTSMQKNLSVLLWIIFIVILFSLYFFVPFFLLRFYNSAQLVQLLKLEGKNNNWFEQYEERILILVILFSMFIFCLQMLMFFRGIIPFFGTILSNMTGMLVIELTLFGLTAIIWGTLKRRIWAWRAGLLFFLFWLISVVITFLKNSYSDILSVLNLPATEMNIFKALPLQSYYFVFLFGIPLAVTIYLIFKSRSHFKYNRNDEISEAK